MYTTWQKYAKYVFAVATARPERIAIVVRSKYYHVILALKSVRIAILRKQNKNTTRSSSQLPEYK